MFDACYVLLVGMYLPLVMFWLDGRNVCRIGYERQIHRRYFRMAVFVVLMATLAWGFWIWEHVS